MEYIVLYLIALFPVFYYDNSKRVDANNRYLIFEWLCVVCLMGFRYHVGGDSFSYEDKYANYPTLSHIDNFNFSASNYGLLWDFFTIFCKSISKEFWVQQILLSMFVNFSFFYFFKRHARNYFLAIFFYILLYIFKYNTEVLRASMSVAVFLFSFDYLIKKKWLKYYVFCVIAFLFHQEATILFFLPLIHLFDKVKINILTVVIILGIVYFLTTSLSLFPVFQELALSDAIILGKLEKYGTIVEVQINIFGILYNLVVNYFSVCALIWLRKDVRDKYNALLLLYIVFRLLSLRWSHITGRLEDFFILFVIAAFINQLNKEVVISRKIILKVAISAFVVLTFVNTTLRLFPLVYPYHSIFNPVDEPDRELLFIQMVNNEDI